MLRGALTTCSLILAFGAPSALANEQVFDTKLVKLKAEIVADGIENPWGLDFLPGGGAIVTERGGAIRILTDGGLSEPLAGTPEVAARGQGGLLDVAVAPDFATSGTIFLSYSEPSSGGAGTALARAKLVRDGDSGRLEDVKVIFSMAKKTALTRHFGSRIVPRPDGTVFVTTGDRGDGDRSQDMTDHAGAVVRVTADGGIPADNPFADGKAGASELWSKGHRNIQGAAFDPLTGSVLTVEHGAAGGDELNLPQLEKTMAGR